MNKPNDKMFQFKKDLEEFEWLIIMAVKAAGRESENYAQVKVLPLIFRFWELQRKFEVLP